MVDANSAYQLQDLDRLRGFDQYDLTMIEQPLAWDDIYQHALLQAQMRTPICLDECINTPSHAEAAIKLGACRVINIKLGRVGGHTRAKEMHDICRRNSIPVWCGGMLESGVGRAHNIAMSALPGFVLPGMFRPVSAIGTKTLSNPRSKLVPAVRFTFLPGQG